MTKKAETKKIETAVEETRDMKGASIYEKLQRVRVDVQNAGAKKGGRNKFGGYDYFELPDFLPYANLAFEKNRATPVFNAYAEYADLTIYDWDSDAEIYFRTESADATVYNSKTGKPANLEIQYLGSTHTYLKRYLYMHVLELAEHDGLEATTADPKYDPRRPAAKKLPEPTKKAPAPKQAEPQNEAKSLTPKATRKQIMETMELFEPERIENMLKAFKITKLTEMGEEQLEKILTIQKNNNKKQEAEENNKKETATSLDEL